MTKIPAACPKCGTEQPIEAPRPRRTGGNVADDKRPKKISPAAEDADVEVEVEGVEEDDVPEDAGDLEDDADTVGAEIEVGSDADEIER